MTYVSKDDYVKACTVDLSEWLLCHHSADVFFKYGSVQLNTDNNIWVKRGYHGYKNFRTGESGNNVDYLINFLGYDYPGAVIALNDNVISHYDSKNGYSSCLVLPQIESKDIVLPKAATSYRNLFAFLQGRKIPVDIIQMLIDKKLIYQSAVGNNIVFINPERDYYELRGTNTYADQRCKKRNNCSEYECRNHQWCKKMEHCSDYKKDTFHGCKKSRPDRFWYLSTSNKKSNHIYICEAAIDAISLYIMHQKHGLNESTIYVSIGGVANQQTINRIKFHCKDRVVIATDNDPAGDECRFRNPELSTIKPVYKDWNEDLKKGVYYESN